MASASARMRMYGRAAFAAAISRALASGTELMPPSPASRCRPDRSNMNVQRFAPLLSIVR